MFVKMGITFTVILSLGFMTCGACAMDTVLYSGLGAPTGLAMDRSGRLYVSQWSRGQISMLENNDEKIILEGISSPAGLAFDNNGNLYFTSYGDGHIYVWNGKGQPRVLASGFSAPTGILWTNDNKLLVANRNAGEVVAVDTTGRKTVLSTGHDLPVGVAQLGDGTIFVSCYGGTVDILSPGGQKLSFKGIMDSPGVGIVAASDNAALVVDYTRGNIVLVNKTGVMEIVATDLPSPVALSKAPNGDLLIGCWGDNSLRLIDTEEK